MANEQTVARLEFDTQNMVDALKRAENQAKSTGKALEGIGAVAPQFKKAAENADRLQASLNNINAGDAAKSIKQAQAQAEALNAEAPDFKKTAEALSSVVSASKKLGDEPVKAIQTFITQHNKATNEVKKLKKELSTASEAEAIADVTRELKIMETQALAAEAGLKALGEDVEKLFDKGKLKRKIEVTPEITGEAKIDVAKDQTVKVSVKTDASDAANEVNDLLKEYDKTQKEIEKLTETQAKFVEGSRGYEKITARLKEVDAIAKKLEADLKAIGTNKFDVKVELEADTPTFMQKLKDKVSKIDSVGSIQIGQSLAEGDVGGAVTAGVSAINPIAGAATGAVVALISDVQDLRKEFTNTSSQAKKFFPQEDADAVASRINAIGKTFGAENEDLLASINALSKEYEISFEAASQAVESALANGTAPPADTLNWIKEYSTQIKAVGLSVNEFINFNAAAQRQGIYDDKALDAAKEFGIILSGGEDAVKRINETFDAGTAKILLNSKGVDRLKEAGKAIAALPIEKQAGAITQLFGAAGEDSGLKLLGLIQNLDNSFKGLTESQRAALDANKAVADSEKRLVESLKSTGGALTNAGSYFTAFKNEAIGLLITAFTSLWGAVSIIFEPFKRLFRLFSDGKKEGSALFTVFDYLKKAIEIAVIPLRVWFSLLAKGINTLIDVGLAINNFVASLGFVNRAVSYLSETLPAVFTAIATSTERFFGFIGRKFNEYVEKISGYIKPVVETVETVAKSVGNFFISVGKYLEDLTQDVVKFFNSFTIFDGIAEKFKPLFKVFDTIVATFSALGGLAQKFFEGLAKGTGLAKISDVYTQEFNKALKAQKDANAAAAKEQDKANKARIDKDKKTQEELKKRPDQIGISGGAKGAGAAQDFSLQLKPEIVADLAGIKSGIENAKNVVQKLADEAPGKAIEFEFTFNAETNVQSEAEKIRQIAAKEDALLQLQLDALEKTATAEREKAKQTALDKLNSDFESKLKAARDKANDTIKEASKKPEDAFKIPIARKELAQFEIDLTKEAAAEQVKINEETEKLKQEQTLKIQAETSALRLAQLNRDRLNAERIAQIEIQNIARLSAEIGAASQARTESVTGQNDFAGRRENALDDRNARQNAIRETFTQTVNAIGLTKAEQLRITEKFNGDILDSELSYQNKLREIQQAELDERRAINEKRLAEMRRAADSLQSSLATIRASEERASAPGGINNVATAVASTLTQGAGGVLSGALNVVETKQRGDADIEAATAKLEALKAQREAISDEMQKYRDVLNNPETSAAEKEFAQGRFESLGGAFDKANTAVADGTQKLHDTVKDSGKAVIGSAIELAKQTVDLIFNAINEGFNATIAALDKSIEVQKSRVEEVQSALEKGGEAARNFSGEQLQAEEARLRKLEELKKREVEQQQATAIIQMAIQAGLAVAQAFATYPPPISFIAAGLTIAGFVASVAALQAKAKSAVPKAEKGMRVPESRLLDGPRHAQGGTLIEAEGGEYIFSREKSKQFEPFFDGILKGSILPGDVLGGVRLPDLSIRPEMARPIVVPVVQKDDKEMLKKLDALKEAVSNISVNVNWDKRGVAVSVQNEAKKMGRIRNKR